VCKYGPSANRSPVKKECSCPSLHTAQKLVNLLNFGVLLFVLFAEPVHFGMFVGVWRVVVRVRAFHV